MDFYDKMKPSGICISGYIDDFSRDNGFLQAGVSSRH